MVWSSVKRLCAIAIALLGTSALGQTTWQPLNPTDFATALANCNRGDTIILSPTGNYQGSFTLREITTPPQGDGYVTIRTSAISSIPAAGTRILPAHAVHLPKIQSTGGNAPAIKTAPRAHHFKLIGLELIGPSNNSAVSSAILMLGDPGSTQNSLTQVPNNIIVDRCIFRANTPNQSIQRVISLHTASTDILNCHIKDGKMDTIEAQCIGGWNGPGPYNITNNYLEGAGENIMFGGATSHIQDCIPSDILINKNHFYIPMAWQGQTGTPNWAVKNHLELKAGRRVTIDSNIFENSFHDAGNQMGSSLVFKTIQQPGQGSAWTLTEDVTVTRNIIKNVGIGVFIGGSTNPTGGGLNGHPRRLTFKDNIFHDINQTYSGNVGRWLFLSNAAPDLTFDHNTAFHTHSITHIGGNQFPNFVFKNNLTNQGSGYGWKGDNYGDGETTLGYYMPVSSGLVWQKNVIMGASPTNWDAVPAYKGGWDLAPFNNASLAFATNAVQNQANPGLNFAGYKVQGADLPTNTTTHPYNNTGTDGKDIGADIDAVVAATAGCVSGSWTSTQVTKTLRHNLNGYTGATSFHASGQASSTYHGPVRYYHTSDNLPAANNYMMRAFYKFDVSPAASGIPAGATIDSAVLKLKVEYVSSTTNYGISAHRVAPVGGAFAVNYGSATRDTYNGTSNWTGNNKAGGDIGNTNNDFLDTPDSSVAIPAAGQWVNLNITSSVQAWVNGTPNNGVIVRPNDGPSPAVTVRLSTPQDSGGVAEYAELVVTYH